MRKFYLGLGFLACTTFLTAVAIFQKTDLLGLSTVIGAMAGGVLAIVWGNVKEHLANGVANGTTKSS